MNYSQVTSDNIQNTVMTDKIFCDNSAVCFLSIIGYKNVIDDYVQTFCSKTNEKNYINIRYKSDDGYFANSYKTRTKYNSIVKKIYNTDLAHAIIYLDNTGLDNDNNIFYIYIKDKGTDEANREELEDKVFEIIEKYSSIPFLKEWIERTVELLLSNVAWSYDNQLGSCSLQRLDDNEYRSFQSSHDMLAYKFRLNDIDFRDFISYRLKTNEFNINGSNIPSTLLDTCQGLNDYLDIFGETLAVRIQETLKPKFIPDEDEYDYYTNLCDDFIHNNGKELFEAQKAVIQSIVNNWKTNNNTMVIGECGCGN